ncbi:phosphoribosyltransferase [Nonomuraea muscovyensis]|uniref:phosphoribosyltransferase n=1 Tax=Nonomuraea muscovyensis TaxID=1124761 RepID=UPI0033C79D64
MGDASAVTQPYLPVFRNVPAAGPGVCRVCHSGPNERRALKAPYEMCASCRRTTGGVFRHTPHVVPVSLCARRGDGTQLYDIVARHRGPVSPSGGPDRSTFLAATLARFHRAHRACLTRAAGGEFTLVTTVPVTRTDRPVEAFHPMLRVVGMVRDLMRLHRPVLLPGDSESALARLAGRESDDRAFHVIGGVGGARVLLVDDLFVSGARVQSAASALFRAGARAVVALVVARLVDPSSNATSARVWARASAERFDFERCCLCGPAAGCLDRPA